MKKGAHFLNADHERLPLQCGKLGKLNFSLLSLKCQHFEIKLMGLLFGKSDWLIWNMDDILKVSKFSSKYQLSNFNAFNQFQ